MSNYILEKYIKPLETSGLPIIGVYIQGSSEIGYSDEYSDLDYSVVWKDNYPNENVREHLLKDLNLPISHIVDQDHKGTDRFMYNETEHNISHRLSSNFFNIYNEVQTEKVNEPKLYILGGFKRGRIIHDPSNKLMDYVANLEVTSEIVKLFKETRHNSTKNNLAALAIATKRKQPVEFIKSLNYLLITFSIQLYLENGQFPVSPKWVEKDAIKYGWKSSLLDIIKKLKTAYDFDHINNLLNNVKEELHLL